MVKSKYANYNKYLRELASFPSLQLLLDHLVVPTSVVFAWNRISLVLKGEPYDSLNWSGPLGCDVKSEEVTIRKEDINHLVMGTVQSTEAIVEAELIRGYSMVPKPVNEYYIITTCEENSESAPSTPTLTILSGVKSSPSPSSAAPQLALLSVPGEDEAVGRRYVGSPSRLLVPGTPLFSSGSPMGHSRSNTNDIYFANQQRVNRRMMGARSPSNAASSAMPSHYRSVFSSAPLPSQVLLVCSTKQQE